MAFNDWARLTERFGPCSVFTVVEVLDFDECCGLFNCLSRVATLSIITRKAQEHVLREVRDFGCLGQGWLVS